MIEILSSRGTDLFSTPRLPPVPEETALPPEDTMYRNSMSVDTYNTHGYNVTGSHPTAATMPTSQMTIHGTQLTSHLSLLFISYQQTTKSTFHFFKVPLIILK